MKIKITEKHKKIKIDDFDVWSADETLSLIILPLLKKLRKQKHGTPATDVEDAPISLTEDDDFSKTRWNWILSEMIWTFEQLQPNYDWEAQYHSGKSDFKSIPIQWDKEGKPTLFLLDEGPKHTHTFDNEGWEKHNKRIENGLRLFGKHFRSLWT
jgi:hypothetical protein